MVSAVIVAAGSGSRMGADKLFLEIEGRPVVAHTWFRFDGHPEIGEIILVVREDAREQFEDLAKNLNLAKPFRIVVGGSERQDSVMNGLEAVGEECEFVAVQDGARPCTPDDAITGTLAAAREGGAAVSAGKVFDTLKEANAAGQISRNVDRTFLWAVQTPQIFSLEIIRRAMAAVREQGENVTDDTAACELIGQPVTLVECLRPNPKVTTAGDLPLVRLLLRQ